jgi:hypothetical protein
MKKSTFLILFPIILISCSRNQKSNKGINQFGKESIGYVQLVPDSIVCETINYLVNDGLKESFEGNRFIDKPSYEVLESDDSLKLLELDTLFSKQDLEYIFKQNSNAKYYQLNKCLDNKTFISIDTLKKFNREDFWTDFRRKYGQGGFNSISIPLFTCNRDIIIIQCSHSCGRLCGSGGTYIFKKQESKWVQIHCLQYWVS